MNDAVNKIAVDQKNGLNFGYPSLSNRSFARTVNIRDIQLAIPRLSPAIALLLRTGVGAESLYLGTTAVILGILTPPLLNYDGGAAGGGGP